MFSIMRKRFTYANVALTATLVFAMSGGAYAAKHYLITSTKQISPSVLKQLKGARGPSGPAGKDGAGGPAGKDGANGKDGQNGGAGQNGAPGENVTTKTVATSDKTKCGSQGGAEYTVGGKTTLVCNGAPWSAGGTLPAGQTLKGEWNVGGHATEANQVYKTSVSYALPLATAPTTHYIRPGGSAPTGCLGNAAEPGAEPGNLCVFATEEENSQQELSLGLTHFHFPTICQWETGDCNRASPTAEGPGSMLGFGVQAESEAEGLMEAFGSWAVAA